MHIVFGPPFRREALYTSYITWLCILLLTVLTTPSPLRARVAEHQLAHNMVVTRWAKLQLGPPESGLGDGEATLWDLTGIYRYLSSPRIGIRFGTMD